MKFLIKFIIVLVVIFVVIPFIAYKYFFSGSPRDLGVKYTSADYTQAHQDIGTEVASATSSSSVKDSLQFSGKKDAKLSLNSSEITAYVNADKYVYAPFSRLQVKINSDGTGEISGLLNINNALAYVSLTTPTQEVEQAIAKFHIPANPPFYAKGTVVVSNNQVNLNIQSLEVGRIAIPGNYLSENVGALNNFATDRLNSIPNLQVRSLTLSGGQVNLDATVPAKVLKVEK